MSESRSTSSRVRFLHLRRPHVSLTREGMHYDSAGLYGGITVAYRYIADNAVVAAFARCRPDELYQKHIGRNEALAKLVGVNDVVPLNVKDGKPIDAIAAWVSNAPHLRRNVLLSASVQAGLVQRRAAK